MPFPLISTAIGVARAGIGAIQANQAYKRQRGMIGRAYQQGRARLDTYQADARQTGDESLVARGLAGAGSVHDTGVVRPSAPAAGGMIARAHDLGGQQVADLRREQELGQGELTQQRDNAYHDAHAERTGAYLSSIAAGVQTGVNAHNALGSLGALKSLPSAASNGMGDGIPGFGGIDAIDPLRRGAWATPTTGSFNVFGRNSAGGMY